MKTEILKIYPKKIDHAKIAYAADILKNGGLVAFPTETVYGLGADAFNEKAVLKIFEAKGRPPDNPLIVHIHDISMISLISDSINEEADIMMKYFWPGPITIIVPKSSGLPGITTANLNTVAIRIPSHPVARALIEKAGTPVAAPSANMSGSPSTTSAKHVINDLMGKIDAIIDAGSSNVGLESTVIDATVTPPVILRPGIITSKDIESSLNIKVLDFSSDNPDDGAPKSPGMKYRHYSPKADMILFDGKISNITAEIKNLKTILEKKGLKVGILATSQTRLFYNTKNKVIMGDRGKPETIVFNLYSSLRQLDAIGVDIILAEAIPWEGAGQAVMNRLLKASGYNVRKV